MSRSIIIEDAEIKPVVIKESVLFQVYRKKGDQSVQSTVPKESSTIHRLKETPTEDIKANDIEKQ